MEQGKAGRRTQAAERRPEAEDRTFYKIGEVCEMTDTQPYVLRFWESEFPQLAPRKSRSGQRIYQKKDVDLVLRIKKLLYEEEYTIAGARKKLEEDGLGAAGPADAPGRGGRAAARSSAVPVRKLLAALRSLRQELRGLKEMLERRRS